jgi:voltage-gated potassium channel
LSVLRASRALPLFRLAVFGGRGSGATLTLLRRRRLGQLAIVSVLVVLLGAAAGLLLEAGAPGAPIEGFGDALWWSAALVTTVGSEIYPVTAGGRVLGILLMLYAVGIFSYFIASIASVLVGLDARQGPEEDRREEEGVRLDTREVETLRRILDRVKET